MSFRSLISNREWKFLIHFLKIHSSSVNMGRGSSPCRRKFVSKYFSFHFLYKNEYKVKPVYNSLDYNEAYRLHRCIDFLMR